MARWFALSGFMLTGLLLAGRVELGAAAQDVAQSGAAGPGSTPSRDVRSAGFCSRQANIAGFYDTEAALACRREEYTAAARARAMTIAGEIDIYCDLLAAEGDPAGPFSWRAYVDCVDGLRP